MIHFERKEFYWLLTFQLFSRCVSLQYFNAVAAQKYAQAHPRQAETEEQIIELLKQREEQK